MLASLYIGYVILLAKWKPHLMPPLTESEARVPLPPHAQALAVRDRNAINGLFRASFGGRGVPIRTVYAQLVVTMLPALVIAGILFVTYRAATAPVVEASAAGLIEAGGAVAADASEQEQSAGLIVAPESEEEQSKAEEKPQELSAAPAAQEDQEPAAAAKTPAASETAAAAPAERRPVPTWYWVVLAIGLAAALVLYWAWSWERLEVFKLLLTSFFPLALLIVAVLGSIVVGLATPAEAAAVGAFGGFVLAAVYRFLGHWRERSATRASVGRVVAQTMKEFGTIIKESSFLTAKTSAMVCWLFVGSGIFSAAFALLGGQEIIEKWVLSLNMTPLQFMILAQIIIFILGWPLEWTEIIIIFMPIFIPLLPHFGIDPLFFGLLVALNLQTAFLSPPVAMAAFYLKGVSPPHVTLNQIFAGMLPFMGIQVIALILLYTFPQIGLWLPGLFYGR
jgi:TRAP-type mannitol/chloroaromatic compound transport system permease large subunit